MHITITQSPLFEKGYPYTFDVHSQKQCPDTFTVHSQKDSYTIQDIVNQAQLNEKIPFICQINGLAVLRKDWTTRIVSAQDVVTFTYFPLQGGGGGRGTSRAIAMIGMLALATAVPGMIGVQGKFLTGLVTSAVGAVGALAVNAILPPVAPSFGDFAGQEQPSSTYTIQAQGNQARIGNVIPVQYGTHKIYPDFASTPYSNYIDNEQYLHLLLCIGQGYFDTDNAKLYIDDTLLENYASVSYHWINPDEALTGYVFKTNVSEIGSFEMKGDNEAESITNDDGTVTQDERWLGWYTVNNAGTKIDEIEIDFSLPQGSNGDVDWDIETQRIDDDGQVIEDGVDTNSNNVIIIKKDVTKSYTRTTSSHPYFQNITKDISYSQEWIDTSERTLIETTIETLRIYEQKHGGEQGDVYTVWKRRVTEIYEQKTPYNRYSHNAIGEALYFTRHYQLSQAGRWQIRLRRKGNASTDVANPDKLYLTSVKGHLVDVSRPPNVTLLAMTIKATSNLASSNLKINTVIQRQLPVYENNAWTEPQSTNSIAWALADVMRNTVYGGGLNDTDFDITGLQELDAIWSENGDSFNGVFDTSKTIWEALQDIAKCGRATPVYQAGKIRIVRDKPQAVAVQMFSDRNIVKDSFSLQYIMAGDKPSGYIEAEYYDDRLWKQKTVTTNLEASEGTGRQFTERTSNDKATHIRLFGITDAQHAQRECDYMARANTYRRMNISFSTELEGLNVQFGDLIKISHEMPGWSIARGDVIAYDAPTKTLTLYHDIHIENNNCVMLIRDIDGRPKGTYTIESIDKNAVVLSEPLDFTPQFHKGEYPHYVIGQSDSYAVDALVRKVTPRGDTVTIEAVIEDNRVHG